MWHHILFNLIYPAVVAVLAAVCSFWGSYRLNKSETNRQHSAMCRDFIDKMLMSLNRLNDQLIILANDPIKYSYFSFQNIAVIKPVLQRLQFLIDEKLSLFSDMDFKSKVLDALDSVHAIIEEIESKESHPVKAFTDHQNIVKESIAEYKALKLKLLEMDIYLDDKDEPQLFVQSKDSTEVTEEKLKQVKIMVSYLNNAIKNSEEQLKKNNQEIERQRSFLAVRIVTSQSKIKDLITVLKAWSK